MDQHYRAEIQQPGGNKEDGRCESSLDRGPFRRHFSWRRFAALRQQRVKIRLALWRLLKSRFPRIWSNWLTFTAQRQWYRRSSQKTGMSKLQRGNSSTICARFSQLEIIFIAAHHNQLKPPDSGRSCCRFPC